MTTPIAVLDACVIYPIRVCDLLLWLARVGLYGPRWSAAIHAEWTGHLAADRSDLTPEGVERRRLAMDAAFPGSLVTGYEELTGTIQLPDPDDRHVLAAAITAEAGHIVTTNLKDFPPAALAEYGVTAVHPDEFVVALAALQPDAVRAAARRLRANLIRRPVSVEAFLANLTRTGLPRTAAFLGTQPDDL